MKKKDSSKIFLIVAFSLILLLPLIWFPINHLLISSGKKTLVLTDNWKYYAKTGDVYIDLVEELKVSAENRVNNYFPFYQNLTSSYNNINYSLNNLFLNNGIIGKNTDNEIIKYNEENEFYYVNSKHSDYELEQRYKNTVDFFNKLVNYNDVNLYLYTILRYEMTKLGDRDLYDYIETFKEDLDNKIKFDFLKINSIQDYTKYFYRTDHHWNAYGAMQGYKDIMTLMNLKAKDYSVKEYDLEYYGSLAKSVLSKKVVDTFSDIAADNNTLITDISNCDGIKYKPREITDSKNAYYDQYVSYFNGQVGHVSLQGNTKSKRNLLIFSDSIVWSIDYLIAEQFNNTYIINLRYNEFENKDVNYSMIVDDFEITDVLFLYEGATLLFDEFDHRMHERITRW